MTRRIKTVAAAVLAACSMMFTGCDCGGGGGSGGNFPSAYQGDSKIDARLILPLGWAWADTYVPGNRDGFRFNADGTFQAVAEIEGVWYMAKVGTLSTTMGALESMTISSGWLYHAFDQEQYITYYFSSRNDTLTLSNGDYWEKFVPVNGVNPDMHLAKPRVRAKTR